MLILKNPLLYLSAIVCYIGFLCYWWDFMLHLAGSGMVCIFVYLCTKFDYKVYV